MIDTTRSLYAIEEFVCTVKSPDIVKLLGHHVSLPGGAELQVIHGDEDRYLCGRVECIAKSVYLPENMHVIISLDSAMRQCVIGLPGESRQQYKECHHRRRENGCYACFRKWWESRVDND